MNKYIIGTKPVLYKFGSPQQCYYYYMFQGSDITNKKLSFPIAMEEDILYTLYWFDCQCGMRNINACYKVEKDIINLYIHEDDIKFMITLFALEQKRLIRRNKNIHRHIHIETEIPFLLQGLVFGKDDLFLQCYHAFCRLFQMRYFQNFHKNLKVMNKLKNICYYTPLYESFQKLLTFLGKCLQKNILRQKDLILDISSPLLRAIMTYCYCLNTRYFSSINNFTIKMVGLTKFNNIYRTVGKEITDHSCSFDCNPDDVCKVYECCFRNMNVHAFSNTFFLNKSDFDYKERNVKNINTNVIDNLLNFSESFMNKTKVSKVIKDQYQNLQQQYELFVYDNRSVCDLESETNKLRVLLPLLDSLKLLGVENHNKYNQKTKLYSILNELVLKRKVKSLPLIVPTLPELDGNGDHYSTSNWVFPIFKAKLQYELDTNQWKKYMKGVIRNNIYKIS